MPSYGPNPCTTVTQIGVGNAWNNPNNIKLNDGNSADCEPWQLVYGPGPVIIGKDPYQSQTLHTVGYGFTVPTYYAISRVKVSVWRYETSPRYPGTSVKDLQIQLVVAGVASGTNKAATSVTWDNSVTQYDYDYDLTVAGWNLALTPDAVNAATFGVDVACQGAGPQIPYPFVGLPAPIGYIDYVAITVEAVPGWYQSFMVIPPYAIKPE